MTDPISPQHLRAQLGVVYPHPSLEDSHAEGSTESWIAQALCGLLVASGGRRVLETGAFRGTTTAWLALTLERMGGGELHVCEIDPERMQVTAERLAGLELPTVDVRLIQGDVLAYLRDLPDRSLDFIFVDDDHHPMHVEQEMAALWPKLAQGGLACFHDVVGSTASLGAIVKKYGGIALDLPRLGPGGGLGIIQRSQ